MLRCTDDWQDYRSFAPVGYGRQQDPSVRWQLSDEDELGLLLAGGEGLHAEFKEQVAIYESSWKTMLKTVAAFASGEGGTVLIGVDDDARVVGINPRTLDELQLQVGSKIRDLIEPEPPYTLRVAEVEGRALLLIQVSPGRRWYALNPRKPEFYVRRGASTLPARVRRDRCRILPFG